MLSGSSGTGNFTERLDQQQQRDRQEILVSPQRRTAGIKTSGRAQCVACTSLESLTALATRLAAEAAYRHKPSVVPHSIQIRCRSGMLM